MNNWYVRRISNEAHKPKITLPTSTVEEIVASRPGELMKVSLLYTGNINKDADITCFFSLLQQMCIYIFILSKSELEMDEMRTHTHTTTMVQFFCESSLPFCFVFHSQDWYKANSKHVIISVLMFFNYRARHSFLLGSCPLLTLTSLFLYTSPHYIEGFNHLSFLILLSLVKPRFLFTFRSLTLFQVLSGGRHRQISDSSLPLNPGPSGTSPVPRAM